MKTILLSTSLFFTIGFVNAQILTQANQAPAPGDVYSTYQCDSAGILPGGNGAGMTWNFSSITVHNSVLLNYTALTSANATYNPANVVVSSGSSNSSYYKSSASDLKYYGGNIAVSSVVANLIYSTPAVFMAYPMALNTTTSSVTGGTVNVTSPFPIAGTFTGTAASFCNATGTLTLPGKVFTDVIRVTTSQVLNATLSITTATVTQLNYEFYSISASKAPIFSISTSTVTSPAFSTNTQTVVTVQKDYLTVGVNEAKKEAISLSVFPNPASTILNISTESDEVKLVEIYDLTGKRIDSQLFNQNTVSINTSDYKNGLYIYQVIGKSNQKLSTGKFSVSK